MILVLGIPGVGKTSLSRLVAQRLGLRHINYGDILLRFIKMERDDIRRTLPPETYRALQEKALEVLLSEKGNYILDTHALISTPFGFFPGIPLHHAKKLSPQAVVHVEATPEEIVKRRIKDVRRRGGGLEDLIDLHQNLSRAAALQISLTVGSPLFIVHNREGKLEEAVEEVVKALEPLVGKVGR